MRNGKAFEMSLFRLNLRPFLFEILVYKQCFECVGH